MSGDRSRTPSDSRSRSHSRSRSRSRSRSGSYNSDSYSDYSDEFYSDAESFRGGKNNKTNNTNKPNYAKRKPVKPTSKKTGRTSKMSSIRDSHDSQVAHRMLSARRLKVNELRNRVEELNQQLYEVERENKLLKRQNVMKDRVIDKHEGEDSEVPRLIQRHTNEIRTLKEQMRKYKEKSMKLSDNVKDKDSQLVQTRRTLQKYKKIVESKNLGERDHLANKLTSAESALDDSRRRVQELERHIENLQKNHRHELGIERARHKETKAQLKDLADRHDQIDMQLREKEKELDVRNIYSMRVMKPPHKLNSALTSTSSTPAPSSRRSTGSHQRKNSDPMIPQHRRNQKAAMQETKRLAIGSAEGHHRKPELKDASCGTSQGFFLTQDTFTNESDWMSKSNDPVGTSHGNHENRNDICVSKYHSPKDDDKSQINNILNTKLGNGTEISSPKNHHSNTSQTDKTPKKSSTRTQKKLLWLVSSRQTTYLAHQDENSYLPSFQEEETPPSWRKGSAMNVRKQSAKEVQNAEMNVQRVTQEYDSSEATMGPQPSQTLWVNQKLEAVARQRERDDTLYEEPKASSRKGPSSRDRERARMREEEDMRRAEEEERDRMREEAERMKRVAEEKARIEMERKEKEEAERREIEEAKRRMEEEERKKKDEEERQRFEIERKAQEERERLARDAEEQERQRKKQALLAKLSAMDEPEQNGKNKNILTMSPTRTRKDWKFTDPVENMYQGKPAYDITSSPKRKNKLLQEEDEFSYKPSFGGKWNNGPKTTTKGKSLFDDDPPSPPKNTNKDKKTDLMASLFGGDAARKPTPPSTEREGSGLDFTFNSNAASRRKASTKPANQARENSVQMFGGGIGVVDDSPPNSSNRLLPKRTNQSSAAFNRPTVNEIDDLDEIEEVVL